MLLEDLTSEWGSPHPRRALADGRLDELHPLSELPHPIVAKAVDSFGSITAQDNYVGPIASATQLRLLEIKNSQWRGGVWQDPTSGVCWLIVAGLAKGNHQDRDDFYKTIERENDAGDLSQWLPTDEDTRLLKQETAARLRTEWELEVQRLVLSALREIHAGGAHRIKIDHPVPGNGTFAHVDLTVATVRDDGYEADEIELEITPTDRFAGSALLWQLTIRVLISIDPPEQGWDRFGNTYSNIGEPGAWQARVDELGEFVAAGDLSVSEPGSTSHYTHRQHLAGKTINGAAVRALCGSYFVPTQDHESMPACPTCAERLAELPE
ncbi:DUF3039 domain-containing protein [Nocardioides sp.]|uniref:DUF3039 domain-containing protein n=1 Tax=Nocardioides sp. TaxID=35761 RepID=UPI00355A54A5